jgi:hypothetical protein
MKFIFPTLWISMFGIGALLDSIDSSDNEPSQKWIVLTVWVIGSLFIGWTCMRLKKVRIGTNAIFISNCLKEIQVPFEGIRDVTENRWINIHPITIHFRVPTVFGGKIIFMPTKRLFGWRTHPIVGELKKLAHLPTN